MAPNQTVINVAHGPTESRTLDTLTDLQSTQFPPGRMGQLSWAAASVWSSRGICPPPFPIRAAWPSRPPASVSQDWPLGTSLSLWTLFLSLTPAQSPPLLPPWPGFCLSPKARPARTETPLTVSPSGEPPNHLQGRGAVKGVSRLSTGRWLRRQEHRGRLRAGTAIWSTARGGEQTAGTCSVVGPGLSTTWPPPVPQRKQEETRDIRAGATVQRAGG